MSNERIRLDTAVVARGLSPSRTRAEEYIRDGKVSINGNVERKPSRMVGAFDTITVKDSNPYVSRAALKLQHAQSKFNLEFKNKIVLDVGSSTGGFTEFALQCGAKKVIAVDVGSDQMHPVLRQEPRIELHEKTDIRDVLRKGSRQSSRSQNSVMLNDLIDIVVCDVSFISLRLIVPYLMKLVTPRSQLILMCKPQFEAGKANVNKGVIKNESMRRKIVTDFEQWLKTYCVVLDKTDSTTPGEKGNIERFFLCKPVN